MKNREHSLEYWYMQYKISELRREESEESRKLWQNVATFLIALNDGVIGAIIAALIFR